MPSLVAASAISRVRLVALPGLRPAPSRDPLLFTPDLHRAGRESHVLHPRRRGRVWVVKEINGESSRCSQYPNWPMIAKMEPYVSEEELAAEMPACLPMGTSSGTTVSMSGVGPVHVRAVNSMATDCSDARFPVSARVVRAKYADQPAPSSAASSAQSSAPQTPPPAPSDTRSTEPLTSASGSNKEQRSAADRLRELKQLRDENLITDAVYESKQKEILANQ